MVSQKKLDQKEKYINLLSKNQNFAVIGFGQSNHQTLEDIRKALHPNAKLTVIKNTIFTKALEKLSQERPDFKNIHQKFFPLKLKNALLSLPDDYLESLKIYFNKVKENKNFYFVFGYIEKNIYDKNGLENLANLPGKKEIMAKLVGSLKSPTSRFIFALKNPLLRLVLILKSKAQKN